MSNWVIYDDSGSASSWEEDGTIPRPNADTGISVSTTMIEVPLGNGDFAYLSPSTKYKSEPIVFFWANQGETFKNKIESYIENNTYLKIETHVSGVSFIGKFSAIQSSWLSGVVDSDGNDIYDISAVFTIT